MNAFSVFLLMGMALMMICMLFANQISYKMPVWKVVVSAIILTGIGLLGAHIMSWIESGNWNGRSFYGAVFLSPLLLWPLSKLIRIRYGNLMDLAAPAECIMLALLKVKCYIDGCCSGRYFETSRGSFQFPSQIVECIAAIIIMAYLLFLIKNKKHECRIFQIYLIIYGVSRFILNIFRETTPWIGPLAAGNFWSLISIVIGLIAIVHLNQIEKKTTLLE